MLFRSLWVDADYFKPVVVLGQDNIDSTSLVTPIVKPAATAAAGTATPTGFTAEELEQKSVYITKNMQGQWGYVLASNKDVTQRVLCARPLTFPRQSQHVEEIKGFRDYMQIDSGANAIRLTKLSMTTQKRLENLPVIDMPKNESIKSSEDQWTEIRKQFLILRNSFNQVNLLFGRINSPEQLAILSLAYSICMRQVRQLEDRILKILNNPRSFVDILSDFNTDKLKNQIVPIKLFMRTDKSALLVRFGFDWTGFFSSGPATSIFGGENFLKISLVDILVVLFSVAGLILGGYLMHKQLKILEQIRIGDTTQTPGRFSTRVAQIRNKLIGKSDQNNSESNSESDSDEQNVRHRERNDRPVIIVDNNNPLITGHRCRRPSAMSRHSVHSVSRNLPTWKHNRSNSYSGSLGSLPIGYYESNVDISNPRRVSFRR